MIVRLTKDRQIIVNLLEYADRQIDRNIDRWIDKDRKIDNCHSVKKKHGNI